MDVAGNLTVADLLRFQVERNPDRDFLVFESDSGAVASLTYRAVSDRVYKLANYLVAQGVKSGDKIAVMLANSPEFVIAWFAIHAVGAVTVPVNTLYSVDELAFLLDHSDSVGIVIEPRFLPTLRDAVGARDCLPIRVLARSDRAPEDFVTLADVEANASASDPFVRVAPESVAQIIYTSGTTSRPKGAMLSHRSSVTQGAAIAMLFSLRSTDRCCITLPLFHVNGQFVSLLPALTAGATVVLLETFSARKFWRQVQTHRSTVISIVPMILRTLLSQPIRADDSLHSLRFSFYALPTASEEWEAFERRFGVTLVEGYGLSETFGICCSNPPVYGRVKRHCIGLPILGRVLRVVDDDMNERPAGEIGQIAVRGEPLFVGYYKDEASTRACMRDGWFLTGDNGSVDEDGYFHFFDRSKDVIKRAGENVAATEVERVVSGHPAVLECAVIGVFDPLRDEAVKAYVVMKPEQSLTEEEVKAWCAAYLAKFKVPEFVEFRHELPKTSIGKIMKYELRAQHRAAADVVRQQILEGGN